MDFIQFTSNISTKCNRQLTSVPLGRVVFCCFKYDKLGNVYFPLVYTRLSK